MYPKNWDGSHPNLKFYVPLLNRIDTIYKEHIQKYKLDGDSVVPIDVPYDEVEVITTCVNYSNQLLEYSTSREIYNSHSYVADLMFSNSLDIKIASLKLICCLSEKFASHFPMKFSLSKRHRDLLITFIKSFPLQAVGSTPGPTPIEVKDYEQHIASKEAKEPEPSPKKLRKSKAKDHNKDIIHVSLYDCMRPDFNVPSAWKTMHYEYYKTGSSIKSKDEGSKRSKKKQKKEISSEGLRTFKLNSEALKKLSIQQIFDKAANEIPKEKWTDFVLHVYIAIAYSGKSFECLAMRGKLVTFKCCAIAAAAANITYSTFVGLVFDEEPYLLSYMCDLVNPDNHVPREPCIAALRAFVNISTKKNGASDLMRALGGNVSHGLLFHILKTILKQAKEKKFNNDQTYMNYLYNMLANLLENKSLAIHLRAAGLMKLFLEFLKLRNDYRMTRSGPLHLIEIFIERLSDAFDEFVTNDGFNILISLLEFEVQFAIDNPDFEGGAPKNCNLSHHITARQVKLLNFLLRLTISLISTYPGDRMRNLYDSPMLKSIIKIMQHPKLFGYELLFNCIHIISTIINNEPTAYAILNESGVIDTFFNNFSTFLLPDNDLLLELPDAINAISLNTNGLLKVKEANVIKTLFSIFTDVKICKQLVFVENVMNFGHAIDELARHHPDLKDDIEEEVMNLINIIPQSVTFNSVDFYASSNGSLYHNRGEPNIHTESNSKPLERWESCTDAVIIQCTLIFLASMFENYKDWKKSNTSIDMDNLFNFVTLKNAPFDYSLSKTILHFRNIIKSIDTSTVSYCLPILLSKIRQALDELSDLIGFSNDNVSYFAKFENSTHDPAAQRVISNLGIINSLLFVFSDFYSKIHKYQPNKIVDIVQAIGDKEGLQLIEDLCLFYKRMTIEEVLLHANTPSEVAKNAFTLVQSISPKQREIGSPPKESSDWNGNSAKFKNISILYFHTSRSKFWLRNIFDSFCGISYGKRIGKEFQHGLLAKRSIAIVTKYINTMMNFMNAINTENKEIRYGFLFCLLNQIYMNMFTSFGASAPVNPIVSICLLQNPQFPHLRTLAIELFKDLGTRNTETIKEFADKSFVSIDVESLILGVCDQVLSIYADLGNVNILGSIPTSSKLYGYLGTSAREYYSEILLSIQVQSSIADFVLLEELLSPEGLNIINTASSNLPGALVETIILISRAAFTNFKTHRLKFKGRLYPISAETTQPTDYNMKFLCDSGLTQIQSERVLDFFGDAAENWLNETQEILTEQFEDIDWKSVVSKDFTLPTVPAIHLDYSPNFDIDTVDDLSFMISTKESNFVSYWINIAQLYPESSEAVANLLLSIFEKPFSESMEEVLGPLFAIIKTADFGSDEKMVNDTLSSTLTLIAFILNRLSFSKYFAFISEFAVLISGHMNKENISKAWFPSALMIFTKIYAESKIPFSPQTPKVNNETRFSQYLVSPPDIPKLDSSIEQKLLNLVLNIELIESEELLLEITNLLILLCKTDDKISELANSKVICSLVHFVRDNQCSLQAQPQVINIIRRSVESTDMLRCYFTKEVDQILNSKPFTKSSKAKDLKLFLEENSALVLRNAELFAEIIGEKCYIKEINRHFKSPLISKLGDEELKVLKDHGIEPIIKDSSSCNGGNAEVMNFLLSELMLISRKDMMATVQPIEKEHNEKEKDIETSDTLLANNKSLSYAIFLLQVITELLFSYTSCKTEFLTFSKKAKNNSDKKPRSTALNMLVHKFITVNPFEKEETSTHKIHEILTSLGCACIRGLISTTPANGIDYNDPKVSDNDVSFARKFTVDILIKILKEVESSKKNSIVKYGRVVDIINLVSKLCGEKIGNTVIINADFDLTKNDRYHFTKELLERKFGNIATGVIARLDMNFPYTEQVSESVLSLLSLLGETKAQFQETFKAEQQNTDAEEDVYEEDDEVKDDAPDLLRNSTLGMYDMEDVEDEDDDFDDFDDAELFADEGIEIILSDNEGNGSDVEIIDELAGDGDDEDDDSDADSDDDSDSMNTDADGIEDAEMSDVSDDGMEYGHRMRGNQIDFVYESDDEDDGDDYNLDMIEGHEVEDYVSNAEADFASEDEMSDVQYLMDEDSASDSNSDDDGDENVIELDIDSMEEDDDEESGDSDDSAILEEWLNEIENENPRGARSRRSSVLNEDGAFPPQILIPQRSNIQGESIDSNSFLEFTQSLLDRRNNNQIQGLLDFRRVFEPLFSKRGLQTRCIEIKSTLQRWQEVASLYNGKNLTYRAIPEIINLVYQKSEVIADEHKRIKEEKERKLKEKEEELKKKRKQEEEELMEMERRQTELRQSVAADATPTEPVYVEIAGQEVDISGTGIDPEFLLALPDDMRQEVYEQHLNQARLERRGRDAIGFIRNLSLVSGGGGGGGEVDNLTDSDEDDFSDSFDGFLVRRNRAPDRDDRFTRGFDGEDDAIDEDDEEGVDDNDNDDEDDDEGESAFDVLNGVISGGHFSGNVSGGNAFQMQRSAGSFSTSGTTPSKKKPTKIYFTSLLDKPGVAALLKLLFVPQVYYKRELFFKTVGFLCLSKHTRAELIAFALYILQEGIKDQDCVNSVYQQICYKADKEVNAKSGKKGDCPVSPANCTTISLATQCIDVIQYLLENENSMRFHFLTEQEGLSFMKKFMKKSKLKDKDNSYKFPINVMLNLLDNKVIKEDTNLMDILSRSIQIATRPLPTMKSKLNELEKGSEQFKKLPQLPNIPDKSLKQIINILIADECANKVFQQTIISIQNLSVLENAKIVFPKELSKKATQLSSKIVKELRELVNDLKGSKKDIEDLPSLGQFSSSASDQAKLLRVLTALDYLYQAKDNDADDIEELKALYKNSALGPLWGALSDCLKLLREDDNMNYIAFILSPLIEALMVVCKHSKVQRMNVLDVLRYEEEMELDFAKEPIESLFFTFTEEHKKILNHMIRNNPKLMSGPFSVLIRNSRVLEFDNKRVYFDQKLHDESANETREKLTVNVRRNQVFLDSYRNIFFKPSDKIRKSILDIKFNGEEGVDAGGITREWYQVLSRQIFDPNYALFIPVASDKTTFHPNRTSWVNPEHLTFFKFVGMIIGKAVYDGYVLDCHFSRAVFKRILGKSVSLKDMESLDLDYYKSLVWMLENDITDIIVETFSVETDDYGEHKIIDLIPNGRDISVTDENKQEYVKLIVEYRLLTSVKDQLDNFLEGFYSMIPRELVSIFDEQELELLVSGLPDIDVDDWKNNTTYENYSASSPQVQWFWRAVKSFDAEERAKLLQFATGTSKVPLNGFKELAGMNGISKFSIHRVYNSTDRLPTAHTCFNQIDLPEYESYTKLRNALLLAIREGHEGFGFA